MSPAARHGARRPDARTPTPRRAAREGRVLRHLRQTAGPGPGRSGAAGTRPPPSSGAGGCASTGEATRKSRANSRIARFMCSPPNAAMMTGRGARINRFAARCGSVQPTATVDVAFSLRRSPLAAPFSGLASALHCGLHGGGYKRAMKLRAESKGKGLMQTARALSRQLSARVRHTHPAVISMGGHGQRRDGRVPGARDRVADVHLDAQSRTLVRAAVARGGSRAGGSGRSSRRGRSAWWPYSLGRLAALGLVLTMVHGASPHR